MKGRDIVSGVSRKKLYVTGCLRGNGSTVQVWTFRGTFYYEPLRSLRSHRSADMSEVIYSHVFYNNDWFKDAICKDTTAPASSIVLICALTLSQKVPNNTNPKISIIQLKLTAFNLVACRFNFPENNVTKRNVTKKTSKRFSSLRPSHVGWILHQQCCLFNSEDNDSHDATLLHDIVKLQLLFSSAGLNYIPCIYSFIS